MKKIRGQSTIEYILLVVGVIIILIAFFTTQGKFRNSLEGSLFKGTVQQLQGMNKQIQIP